MQRKLPPLNALRAFEAAGRHQNFSRAAEELGVSHSAISRHVRGLEHHLGASLFRDRSRGVVLTREGASYLERVSPALDVIAEASEALAERTEGMVVVNGEPQFTHKWLIPRLAGFYAAFPQIDLRIYASEDLTNVDRYEADLAIRFRKVPQEEPNAALISDAPLYPYAAPGLVPLPLDTTRDLLAFPLLKDRASDTWGRWFALAGGVPDDAVPRAPWRLHATLAHESALAGRGVLLTSCDVVANDVAAGRLVQVSPIGFREGEYRLIHAEGALRRKAVRVFRDWVRAESRHLREGRGHDVQPKG